MAPPRLFWVWLLLAGTRGEKDGDMRLANGDAANEGRVEIFYRGQWGTVCDNLWDLPDASVVCRALGFENATEALGGAAFGPGTGPVMLDEVVCTGTESSLAECRSLGWLKSNCRHAQDAGVVCTNETRSTHTLDLSGELSDALGQIFDSQRGCDLFLQVTGQEEDLCAHTLILTANPEAQALWAEPGSNVTLTVDPECVPVVRAFISLQGATLRRTEVRKWNTLGRDSPSTTGPRRGHGGCRPSSVLLVGVLVCTALVPGGGTVLRSRPSPRTPRTTRASGACLACSCSIRAPLLTPKAQALEHACSSFFRNIFPPPLHRGDSHACFRSQIQRRCPVSESLPWDHSPLCSPGPLHLCHMVLSSSCHSHRLCGANKDP